MRFHCNQNGLLHCRRPVAPCATTQPRVDCFVPGINHHAARLVAGEKRVLKAEREKTKAAAQEAKLQNEAPIIKACRGAGIEVKEGKTATIVQMKALIKDQHLAVKPSSQGRSDLVSALLEVLRGPVPRPAAPLQAAVSSPSRAPAPSPVSLCRHRLLP